MDCKGGIMAESKGFRGIEVLADAGALEKCRKQVVAGQPGFGTFAFIADEGAYMPGCEGTAPTPLTYFVSGVALCLLSHLTEIAGKRRLKLVDPRVKVTARFHEQGSALKGDKVGVCDGFDISIQIDSDEPREKILDLMRLARRACFAVDTLSREYPPRFADRLNGEPVEE
jgi:uncharacterized OsmC-like protein